jgi:hypothetical protein
MHAFKVNMATSKLQRRVGYLLDREFPQYRIRENYRPDWLVSDNRTKLELDFYIEEIKMAFEIQGAQHYQFIEFFHGTRDAFEKRKCYDQQKKDLCYGAGVRLIEIFTETDAIVAIRELSDKYNVDDRLPVLPPPEWRLERKLQPKEGKKAKKPKNKGISLDEINPLDKYRDLRSSRFINTTATISEKITEVNQFKKKIGRFSNDGEIPFFDFKYLNADEQDVLLAEVGVLQLIDPDSSLLKAKIVDVICLIQNTTPAERDKELKARETRQFHNFVKKYGLGNRVFNFIYLDQKEQNELFESVGTLALQIQQ